MNTLRKTASLAGIAAAVLASGCGSQEAPEAPVTPISPTLEHQLDDAPDFSSRLRMLAKAACQIEGPYIEGEEIIAIVNGYNDRYNHIQYGKPNPGLAAEPHFPAEGESLSELSDRYCPGDGGAG